MTSAERVRGAALTFADYTLGTVIAMVQLAVADRETSQLRRDRFERLARGRPDRELE